MKKYFLSSSFLKRILAFLLLITALPSLANFNRGFYLGPSIGYGSTDWGFLVTPKTMKVPGGEIPNPAAYSAPIGASDDGFNFGTLIGYKFSKYFAIESSYTHFSQSNIELSSGNYIIYKHHITTVGETYNFSSETQAISLQVKISLPISVWNIKKLSCFTSLGTEVTLRKDIFANKTSFGGAFGGGFAYDLNKRVTSQFYFNYYTGYGKSNIYPVEDYIPFIYQINTAILFYL